MLEPTKHHSDLPLVTVITVVYNGASSIRTCIESVLNQDYPSIEYIIIDGASKDGTIEIIQQYGDRISKIISEKDKGISDAFNKGIRNASGKLIGFMNCDDEYKPGAIRILVKHWKDQKGIPDIIYGSTELYTNKKFYGVALAQPIYRYKAALPFICHQSMLAKAELFNRIGMFRDDRKYGMDFDWILKAITNDAVLVSIPEVVVSRYSMDGYTSRNFSKAMAEFKLIAISYSVAPKGLIHAIYFIKILVFYISEVLKSFFGESVVTRFKKLFKRYLGT